MSVSCAIFKQFCNHCNSSQTDPVNGCYHINMKYFQQHVTNVSFDTITHLYSYPHYVYQILFSLENIAFNFFNLFAKNLAPLWSQSYTCIDFKSNICLGISKITTLYTSVLNRLKKVRILSVD